MHAIVYSPALSTKCNNSTDEHQRERRETMDGWVQISRATNVQKTTTYASRRRCRLRGGRAPLGNSRATWARM